MFNYEMVKNAMADLDEDVLNDALDQIMADGGAHAQEALDACQEGMKIVGKRFEESEYFVGDLIFAGEILTAGVEKLKPAIGGGSDEKIGRMVLCTVYGDLHDIGKNIVKSILEATGFEVLDLGIDTPAEKIVDTVKAENIKIVALSGVLTLALNAMKDTVDALKRENLDDVKVIVGGAPVNEKAAEQIGADAWASSPQKTAEICRGWAEA